MVGMSGNPSQRVAVVTASGRSLPSLIWSIDEIGPMNVNLHLAADQIGERRPSAAIRHVHQIDARHHLEQFAREMRPRAGTGRRHVELARVSLGIVDELRDRPSRNGRMHQHDLGLAHHRRDRRNVANEIEVELGEERGVDGVRQPDLEQRVAVRRRVDHLFGGGVPAPARPVLDHERLAEPLRQPLAHDAREDVVRTAGGKPTNAHRPRRIGLRAAMREAPEARQRPLRDAEIGGAIGMTSSPICRAPALSLSSLAAFRSSFRFRSASLMMPRNFALSAFANAANSSTEIGATSAPARAASTLMSGSSSVLLISR